MFGLMWDDYEPYHNKDESGWERYRNEKHDRVESLLEFLFKLSILKANSSWDPWHGFDVAGFVDRNWKV